MLRHACHIKLSIWPRITSFFMYALYFSMSMLGSSGTGPMANSASVAPQGPLQMRQSWWLRAWEKFSAAASVSVGPGLRKVTAGIARAYTSFIAGGALRKWSASATRMSHALVMPYIAAVT
jgi:hypothetical protein